MAEKRDLTAEILAANNEAPSNHKALRKDGAEAFAALRIPGSKTEEYRFTPVSRVLEKAFKSWPASAPAQSTVSSIDSYLVPGLDCNVAVVLNGRFNKQLSRISDDAYVVEALASTSNPQLTNALGTILPSNVDPFAALNSARWSDGIGVVVNGTAVKPLLVLNINDGSSEQVVHSRLVIKVEEGSSLSVVGRSVTLGTSPVFQTLSEEISVSARANFSFCKIQNETNIIEVCNTAIDQSDESHVNTFTLLLNGVLVRNNLTISIDGERCESHFHGLSLLQGETIGDHHTVVDHKKPNSFSNELYKGVMDDKSKGIFNGKIFVRPHAQKTNAFQSNRNILLTDQSTINTKPQLEIWADDVKCSHGCTTGQLDDEALFYLRSRGIAKDDARALLLYAFASQTTEFITIAPLKAYIDRLISDRLYGSRA